MSASSLPCAVGSRDEAAGGSSTEPVRPPPPPPAMLSTLDSFMLKPPSLLISMRGRPKVDPMVGCMGAREQAACRAAAAASPWGPPCTTVYAVLRVCWKVRPVHVAGQGRADGDAPAQPECERRLQQVGGEGPCSTHASLARHGVSAFLPGKVARCRALCRLHAVITTTVTP